MLDLNYDGKTDEFELSVLHDELAGRRCVPGWGEDQKESLSVCVAKAAGAVMLLLAMIALVVAVVLDIVTN